VAVNPRLPLEVARAEESESFPGSFPGGALALGWDSPGSARSAANLSQPAPVSAHIAGLPRRSARVEALPAPSARRQRSREPPTAPTARPT